MRAIITRFLPATDTRGSRIRATTADAGSITVPYDHALSSSANHEAAARTLADKLGWKYRDLAGGPTETGWAFVLLEQEVTP